MYASLAGRVPDSPFFGDQMGELDELAAAVPVSRKQAQYVQVPYYSSIRGGAFILRFFAVITLLGSVAFFLLGYAEYQRGEYGADMRFWYGGVLIFASVMQLMFATLAIAVRDIARNSFR